MIWKAEIGRETPEGSKLDLINQIKKKLRLKELIRDLLLEIIHFLK